MHEQSAKLAMALVDRPSTAAVLEATKYRDAIWDKAGIRLTKSVDAYHTTLDTAKACVDIMYGVIREWGNSPNSYQYVEPSAGSGPFLKHLPDDTISMDILPRHPAIQRGEFLTWEPPESDKPYAVVGAPPLGNYSDVSVAFINKSLSFADIVGMIVRRHIGERQVSGNLLHRSTLERGAVLDMTGCPIPYKMEWRVWCK